MRSEGYGSWSVCLSIGVAAGPAGPAIAGPIFCLQAAAPWFFAMPAPSSRIDCGRDERRGSACTHADNDN